MTASLLTSEKKDQMKRIFTVLVAAVLLGAFFSCSKKGPDCSYTAMDAIAPDSEVTALQSYIVMHAIDATKAPQGYFYGIDDAGTGLTPGLCSTITVQYTGSLEDGTVFDSTGTGTASFTLGQLIIGWQSGLKQIKAGGRIRLYIPPTLGYGKNGVKDNSGNVIIPGNANLIFDIKLVSVAN
ncbi:MAG: FKBP-type peptidylprolyl isomerase [Bacteroidetes bacterium]|nr:MAG: FKBP-type peptidylprolyl isomerase [Bacteroidota bacterium]